MRKGPSRSLSHPRCCLPLHDWVGQTVLFGKWQGWNAMKRTNVRHHFSFDPDDLPTLYLKFVSFIHWLICSFLYSLIQQIVFLKESETDFLQNFNAFWSSKDGKGNLNNLWAVTNVQGSKSIRSSSNLPLFYVATQEGSSIKWWYSSEYRLWGFLLSREEELMAWRKRSPVGWKSM